MRMVFYVNQQDLRHKFGILVGGNVVDSTEHTTYSSTIKYVYVILIIFIAVKNGLVLMAVDIGNSLCTALFDGNIWSICGAEFDHRCGALVVLKWALYGLKTASKSFHKYFVEFLIDLGFTQSISD